VAHCHPLHKPEHLCYLRSFREVNEVQGQLALINSKAGMSMRTSYEVMGQGVRGTECWNKGCFSKSPLEFWW